MLSSVQMAGRAAAEVAGDLDGLAERTAAEVALRVPEYQRWLAAAGDDPRHAVLASLSLLLASLESRDALAAAGPALRREGAARCAAGVPLDTLIEATSVVRQELGTAMEEAARTLGGNERAVLAIERRLDAAVARYVAELARGFMAALTERWRREREVAEGLVRVAAAVNRSIELADVARAALATLTDLFGADAGLLWLRADDTGELALAYTHRLRWDEDRDLRGEASPVRLVERAVRAGAAVLGSPLPPFFGHAVAVALRSRGQVVGVIAVANRGDRPFTHSDLKTLTAAGDHVAAGLVRASQHRREARTDGLTGLANRSELERQLERAIATARRHSRPLTLVLADLDGLKRINDERGHAAGDEALRSLAAALQSGVRTSDTCARIGGDEFALVMPDASAAHAAEVVRRIHRTVRASGLDASFGLAGWEPGRTSAELFRLADRRLYQNKRRHHREHGVGA